MDKEYHLSPFRVGARSWRIKKPVYIDWMNNCRVSKISVGLEVDLRQHRRLRLDEPLLGDHPVGQRQATFLGEVSHLSLRRWRHVGDDDRLQSRQTTPEFDDVVDVERSEQRRENDVRTKRRKVVDDCSGVDFWTEVEIESMQIWEPDFQEEPFPGKVGHRKIQLGQKLALKWFGQVPLWWLLRE